MSHKPSTPPLIGRMRCLNPSFSEDEKCLMKEWDIIVQTKTDGTITPTLAGIEVISCPSCKYSGRLIGVKEAGDANPFFLEPGRIHLFPDLSQVPATAGS